MQVRLTPNTTLRIIVTELHGHWSAWFEDSPEQAFGGDSPGTAVDRLWGNWLDSREAVDADEY